MHSDRLAHGRHSRPLTIAPFPFCPPPPLSPLQATRLEGFARLLPRQSNYTSLTNGSVSRSRSRPAARTWHRAPVGRRNRARKPVELAECGGDGGHGRGAHWQPGGRDGCVPQRGPSTPVVARAERPPFACSLRSPLSTPLFQCVPPAVFAFVVVRVQMSNRGVVQLFDMVQTGTLFFVAPKNAWP